MAVRNPPGNVAPSPNPSSARAAISPRNAAAPCPTSECDALATLQIATAASIPVRSPT
jgi:hypothetical protein